MSRNGYISRFCLLVMINFWTWSSVNSQDLLREEQFLRKQVERFDQWLTDFSEGQLELHKDADGTPQYALQVNQLEVFLEVTTTSREKVWTIWTKLKAQFAGESLFSLEAFLVNKLSLFTDVPTTQLLISFLDTYSMRESPCVYTIKEIDGEVQTSGPCMSQRDTISGLEISLLDPELIMQKDTTISLARLQKRNKIKIYKRILRDYKRAIKSRHRKATVQVERLSDGQFLKLKIDNIRGEVLQRSLVSRYEQLTIWVKVDFQAEDFTVICDIDGKFGSRFFRPFAEGWEPMEPDYTTSLRSYTNTFIENTILPAITLP